MGDIYKFMYIFLCVLVMPWKMWIILSKQRQTRQIHLCSELLLIKLFNSNWKIDLKICCFFNCRLLSVRYQNYWQEIWIKELIQSYWYQSWNLLESFRKFRISKFLYASTTSDLWLQKLYVRPYSPSHTSNHFLQAFFLPFFKNIFHFRIKVIIAYWT